MLVFSSATNEYLLGKEERMDMKDKIINAMIHEFSIKGYMASMSDISKHVGIKVPSIYSHFTSKDEIIYRAVERELSAHYQFLTTVYDELKKQPAIDILRGIYFGVIKYYSNQEKLRFIHNIELIPNQQLYAKCKTLQKEQMKNILNGIEKIFEQGHSQGEIRGGVQEGYHYLYVTMVQGVLSGLLTFNGQTKLRQDYEKKIWNAFERSIL